MMQRAIRLCLYRWYINMMRPTWHDAKSDKALTHARGCLYAISTGAYRLTIQSKIGNTLKGKEKECNDMTGRETEVEWCDRIGNSMPMTAGPGSGPNTPL